MNINIHDKLKKIILNTKTLKDTDINKYPNSKYNLDLIIDELLYFFKSGISWAHLRSPIKYKTLFWHFTKFSNYNVFNRLFTQVKNFYLNKFFPINANLLIDSTVIFNKSGVTKIGRNKFYKNKRSTKISLMTDVNGFPLSVFL